MNHSQVDILRVLAQGKMSIGETGRPAHIIAPMTRTFKQAVELARVGIVEIVSHGKRPVKLWYAILPRDLKTFEAHGFIYETQDAIAYTDNAA